MVDVGYTGKMGNMSLDDRGDTEITKKLVHYGHIYTREIRGKKYKIDFGSQLSVLWIIGQRL